MESRVFFIASGHSIVEISVIGIFKLPQIFEVRNERDEEPIMIDKLFVELGPLNQQSIEFSSTEIHSLWEHGFKEYNILTKHHTREIRLPKKRNIDETSYVIELRGETSPPLTVESLKSAWLLNSALRKKAVSANVAPKNLAFSLKLALRKEALPLNVAKVKSASSLNSASSKLVLLSK